MNAFLRQIIGLSLIRIILDAALPEDDTGRFSSLGMELAMMLCMLRALAGLLAVSAGG